MSTVAYPHIEIRSDGVPVIAGTGFKVRMLVDMHVFCGDSIESLLLDFPQLTAAGIHGALTYYYDNKAEIDAEIVEGRRFAEQMRAESGESLIVKKLREMTDDELGALIKATGGLGTNQSLASILQELGRNVP